MQINLSFDPTKVEEVEKIFSLISSLRVPAEAIKKESAEKKTQKKDHPVAEVTEISEVEIVKPVKDEDPVKEITDDDLRRLGARISEKQKSKEVKKLLEQFGYERLTTIPQDKRAEFVAEAEKLVA